MSQTISATRSTSKSLKALWKRVGKIEIAMLTTVDKHGALTSRPMANQAIEHEEFLWFFAARDSGKAKAIRANPQVGLVYASGNTFIMANGKARISESDAKAQELWSPAAQSWFPGGPEDSGLVLIVIDVDHAVSWDESGSTPFDLT